MITAFVLVLAISPAQAPSHPGTCARANPTIAVERAYNGRARVHRVRTQQTSAGVDVTGLMTAPTPFPLSQRGVIVEALNGGGKVVATVEGTVVKTPARARRRQPVTVSFEARLPATQDIARLRIRPL